MFWALGVFSYLNNGVSLYLSFRSAFQNVMKICGPLNMKMSLRNCGQIASLRTLKSERLSWGAKHFENVLREEFSSKATSVDPASNKKDDAILNTADHHPIENKIPTSVASSKNVAEIQKWWDDEGGMMEVEKAKKNSSAIFSPKAQKFVDIPYDSWTGCPQKDQNHALRYVLIECWGAFTIDTDC